MSEVTWYALTGSIRPCDEGDADVVDVDDYYTLANENARLAARVATLEDERKRANATNADLAARFGNAQMANAGLAARVADLEAIADRAERLAAVQAYYADDTDEPVGDSEALAEGLQCDLESFPQDHPGHDVYLAAVRAVTRTPADAPQGEQGEGQ